MPEENRATEKIPETIRFEFTLVSICVCMWGICKTEKSWAESLPATQGGLHKEPCVCMLTVKYPDLCSIKDNAENVLDSTVTPRMAYTSSASQLKNKTHQKCPGSLCLVQSKGNEDL